MGVVGHEIGHSLEIVLAVLKKGQGVMEVPPYAGLSELVCCGKLVTVVRAYGMVEELTSVGLLSCRIWLAADRGVKKAFG
jgi:hypothetical protein